MFNSSFKWTINPMKEVDGLLKNKVLRIAMNKASAVVKAAVGAKAPVRHGFLKKSIRIKIRQYKASQVWASVVGPKSDFKKNKGKVKRGPKKGIAIAHRPSNYARLVEQGTKRSKARPFLKPALDQTRNQFQQVLIASIKEQVAQLLPKK